MWCETCKTETEFNNCPNCHSDTVPVPEHGVYWCFGCKIPVLREPQMNTDAHSEMVCPLCGRPIEYLASDLRPVFPEERLLMELLLGKSLALI